VNEYDGKQFVGIDLHRRHSVIVRQTSTGERLSAVRILNDPDSLALQLEEAGEHPDVVLEATYGWYWAVDALQAAGATVHLAHPLGVKGFRYRRVKNDVRDAGDLADLLRMNRLPEAWIAPPATRELRELVRYRAKLVALRSGLKAQAHAVLAKAGVLIAVSDLFGVAGRQRLARVPLGAAYAQRMSSLLELIDVLDTHERRFAEQIAANTAEAVEILSKVIATRTLPEWSERFATLAGPWAPVQDTLQAAADPQVRANEYLVRAGELELVANPVQFDVTAPETGPAPGFAEQTDEILMELGLDWDRIIELKTAGAVT